MTRAFDERDWLSREVLDPGASRSFGPFGALAEFSRERDEPVRSRGGIRLDNTMSVRPAASELTAKAKDADPWSFGRAASRVALRQIRAPEGPSPNLQLWRQTYDRVETTDDDETGHA